MTHNTPFLPVGSLLSAETSLVRGMENNGSNSTDLQTLLLTVLNSEKSLAQ